MKEDIEEYLHALDAWRNDPVRVNTDRLFEAEFYLRETMEIDNLSMREAYGRNYSYERDEPDDD